MLWMNRIFIGERVSFMVSAPRGFCRAEVNHVAAYNRRKRDERNCGDFAA